MTGEQVNVSREHLEASAELIGSNAEREEALRQRGRDQAVHGYEAGRRLGFDTGLGARQDTRSFVHGVMAGFEAGNQARQELARELLDSHRRAPVREVEHDDYDLELGA